MANTGLPQLQACALRVARLQSDGVPLPGADNLYVSDALVQMTFTPSVEEGQEITQPNGCGSLCVNYKEEDEIKRYDVTVQLCTPDPELSELLAGGSALEGVAEAGVTPVGYEYPRLRTKLSSNGVSLELWTKQVDASGDLDPIFPYAHWAFPRVKLRPGDKTFENAAQLTNFVGFAIENPNWFDGPANDWPSDLESAVAWIPDNDIPVTQVGYQTLAAS